MPVARMPNTTLNSMDGFGFERVPKYARNTAAAAMPPNCEMRIDAAGEALVPVAAVSRMPYTMDSANVHTPDTRNTLRKSCFESAPRAMRPGIAAFASIGFRTVREAQAQRRGAEQHRVRCQRSGVGREAPATCSPPCRPAT